jgi:hypothetical protein
MMYLSVVLRAASGSPMSLLHHYCEALGTIRALLEPVADGPEKGRIVYGEFLGPDTGTAGAGG